METSKHICEKKIRYLDSYAFEKLKLQNTTQWIHDRTAEGKSVGHWIDTFKIEGAKQNTIPEIDTVWEALTYFGQGELDFLVIDDTAYTLPQDARTAFEVISNFSHNSGDQIKVSDTEKLSAFTLNLYGKYFAGLNQVSEATSLFSKALKINSSFCEPYNNLAQLLWKVGKQREAFTLFTEALSKNPHLLIAQLNFFEAGMDLEEYDSILNVISYLEEEIPDCVELKYYKAICHHHLGDTEKAKNILNGILKDRPDDEEAKQFLQNYA